MTKDTSSKIYLYRLPPIDHWLGWQTLAEVIASNADELSYSGFGDVERIRSLLEDAQAVALEHGWEGDERQGPFVTIIPTSPDDGIWFAVAWKQKNNGETFIASDRELPWMQAQHCAKEAVE